VDERPAPPAELVVRTARAIAAAEQPEEALREVLSTLRASLGAGGAAVLRTEGDRLVPVVSDNLEATERPRTERALTPDHGGGYPLLLGGRLEGVLLLDQVPSERLAALEADLAPLVDLAAVVLRTERLTEARRQHAQRTEIRSLERLGDGSQPLDALVTRYGVLLDRALTQRGYKVDYDVSDDLQALARELGDMEARPRDVVRIHTTALKDRTRAASGARAQAYLEEARLMVLELMGHLAAYYRER
jgi:hypothetical protein